LGRGCLLYFVGAFVGLIALGLINLEYLERPKEHPGKIVAAVLAGILLLVVVAVVWRRKRV
jgi:hypothetical protein